jgi:predicted Zn-dependent protease
MYMAKAGYDPRQAVAFWQRMAELSGGQGEGISEYLSTHPSNTRRIQQIEEMMPEALELYHASGGAPGTGPAPAQDEKMKRLQPPQP